MRTRTFVVTGLLAALLVAGVASYWASGHPDGLQHVAQQAGFADEAKGSATDDSPLSGYKVRGIENDAVSRGLAGVLGAVVVLVIAGGLTYAVRRRGPANLDEHDQPATDDPESDRHDARADEIDERGRG